MPSESKPPAAPSLPADLPPVRPPSIGFIFQLFVVPGLIVAAIVATWTLFGKIATSETDWQRLVMELQNPNEHRRWRGAMGLAQMLKADQDQGAQGQHLASNPELVANLAKLLSTEAERPSPQPADVQFQSFLAQTCGLLNSPEAVLPALHQALQPAQDREVRKNALLAIAVMTDRLRRAGEPVHAEAAVAEVLPLSQDEDPLLRVTASYTLGLLETPESRARLTTLLSDSDPGVRLNSAIALVRHNDRTGLKVLLDAVNSGSQSAPTATTDDLARFLAVKNALVAIGELTPLLTDEERKELQGVIQPLSDTHAEPAIRVAAQTTLQNLAGQSP